MDAQSDPVNGIMVFRNQAGFRSQGLILAIIGVLIICATILAYLQEPSAIFLVVVVCLIGFVSIALGITMMKTSHNASVIVGGESIVSNPAFGSGRIEVEFANIVSVFHDSSEREIVIKCKNRKRIKIQDWQIAIPPEEFLQILQDKIKNARTKGG
jgi:hypothetical protein